MSDVLPQIVLSSMRTARRATLAAASATLLEQRSRTPPISSSRVDDDGGASLRFGDDAHGMRPEDRHAVHRDLPDRQRQRRQCRRRDRSCTSSLSQADLAAIDSVRNPLPAAGGVDPEIADDVRRNAPEAFRRQERAVTPEDYADVTERYSRRAARRRDHAAGPAAGTRSFITVDPVAGADSGNAQGRPPALRRPLSDGGPGPGDSTIRTTCRSRLELHVCVQPDYFRADVKAGLLDALSSRDLPGGARGLFHPDNFSFGQTVYLSEIYAAAHAVPGVASAQIVTFQRQGTKDLTYLDSGAASARPAGDRASREQPELSRTRRASPRHQRGQIAHEHRTISPTTAAAAPAPRSTRRRRSSTAPDLPAIAYRVGTHTGFQADAAGPAVEHGLSGAGAADHARAGRLYHRAVRCLCRARRRADLLPGAHRQRILARAPRPSGARC